MLEQNDTFTENLHVSAFGEEDCEKILNTLIDSLFVEGRELQDVYKVNVRRIIYVLSNSFLEVSEAYGDEYVYLNYDEKHVVGEKNLYIFNLKIPYRDKKSISDQELNVIDLQLKKISNKETQFSVSTLWNNAEDGWRERIKEKILDKSPSNQGNVYPANLPTYNMDGLYFRSKVEMKVYQALKEKDVLFFPLPVAIKGSFRKEPDFLIIRNGKAFILEINGEPFHNLRKDNERNDIFKLSGKIIMEARDAGECWDNPSETIDKVLKIFDAH